MVERRRWGRRAAVAAAVVLLLAAVGAGSGRAGTSDQIAFVAGTQTNGWYSPDTQFSFPEYTQFRMADSRGNYVEGQVFAGEPVGPLGDSGNLQAHQGPWTLTWWPFGDSADSQSMTIGIDWTPPNPGSFLCPSNGSGWCGGGFTVSPYDGFYGSGIDHVEYRFDAATNPQAAWQTHDPTVPWVVEGQHTVEWYAVDRAGNVGPTQTATFELDATPPVATGTLSSPAPGGNGWYRGPVTVSLSAADPPAGGIPGSGLASLSYFLEDASGATIQSSTPYTGPFTIAREGITRVMAVATDVAGNSRGTQIPVQIDTTPPSATLELYGTPVYDGWYRDSVEALLQGADPAGGSGLAGVECAFGGGSLGPCPLDSEFPIYYHGATTFSFAATDQAGNVSQVQTVPLKIDADPPQTVLTVSPATYGGQNGWLLGPATVSATATDTGGSGVRSTLFCVNASCSRYGGPVKLGTGTYQVSALSTDNVYHVETPTTWNQASFKVDADPPTGTIAISSGTLGQNGWYVSPVDLTIENAADVGSGLAADPFHYQLFHGNRTSFDGTYHDTTEGSVVFDADISDAAGNVTPLPEQTVSIDTRPPQVTLQDNVTHGNGGWDTYAEIDGLYAYDPYPGSGLAWHGEGFSLDGSPFGSLDQMPGYDFGNGDLPLPDGPHTLVYYASDNAGNRTQETQTFLVDSTPPTLTCTATPAKLWPPDRKLVPVKVTVDVSDSGSGPAPGTVTLQSVTSSNPSANDGTSSWVVGTDDTSGTLLAWRDKTAPVYTLTYTAQDVAGNTGSCTVNVAVSR